MECINNYIYNDVDDGGPDNRPKTGYKHTQSRIGTAGPSGKAHN